MVRLSLEVREGADSFEVTTQADSIVQAVGSTERRFPGREVRVLFPIDGDKLFGGEGTAEEIAVGEIAVGETAVGETAAAGTGTGHRRKLLTDRAR